jgi:hypothetical protein
MPCTYRAFLLGALVALSAAGAPNAARGQDAGIRVEWRGDARIAADPGSVLRLVFRVIHSGGARERITPRLDLPVGWRAVTGTESFEVAGPSAAIRVVSLGVPADARPGTYVVRLEARAGRSLDTDSVRVVVRPRCWELELRLADAPRFVLAGESYLLQFRLANRSNEAARVRLGLRSIPELSARVDSAAIRLAPGEARSIAVHIATPPDATAAMRHSIWLTALLEGQEAVRATASSHVDVLPAGGGASRPVPRIPAELRLRAIEPSGAGPQFELRGGGRLGEPAAGRLDFLLRGPRDQRAILGQTDQYRVRYRSERLDLALGDLVYALSPLSEAGQYAFGVGGGATLGDFVIRGFLHRDRKTGTGRTARAAQLGYRFGDRAEIAGQYVGRTGPDSGRVSTLHGAARPLPNTRIDVEYGRRIGSASAPDAVSFGLRAGGPALGLEARHIRADSAYPGIYRGITYDFLRLALSPWRWLRVDGSAQRRVRAAPRGDALPIGDRRSHLYTARISYGSALAVEYRREGRAGWLLGSAYERELESVGAQLGIAAGRFRLRSAAEIGRVLDPQEEGSSTGFQRHSLISSYSPAPGRSYSLALEYSSGATLYSRAPEERLAVSVQAAARLSPAADLQLAVRATRHASQLARVYAVADARLEYSLPFGHRVSLSTRAAAFRAGPAHARNAVIALDYVVPLRIPIPGAGSGASAEVRLLDAESGEGIPGVLVHLADRTLASDAEGRVVFRGLMPGTHALRVDRQSLGLDRVPLQPLPMTVVIAEGRRAEVVLEAARSARVSVEVRLFAFERRPPLRPEAAALVEAGTLPNVWIELSREGEVLRRMTDARGRFEFTDLRPGRWTLSVIAADLPQHHYMEQDAFQIDLQPGDTAAVVFRVLPRRRPVRIIDSGELAVVPAPNPPAGRGRDVGGNTGAPISEYTVTERDISLMNIARIVYGDASLWPKIWLANRETLLDPDIIRPGQLLRVPARAALSAEERRARDAYYATLSPPPSRYRTYRIGPGDLGLHAVARNVYGDASLWPKIWLANREHVPDPDYIRSGDLLLIPPKAPLTPAEKAARAEYRARKAAGQSWLR